MHHCPGHRSLHTQRTPVFSGQSDTGFCAASIEGSSGLATDATGREEEAGLSNAIQDVFVPMLETTRLLSFLAADCSDIINHEL